MQTFALIAFLALTPGNPGQLDSFVIDTNLTEEDCYAEVEKPHRIELGDGVYLDITNPQVQSCEATSE